MIFDHLSSSIYLFTCFDKWRDEIILPIQVHTGSIILSTGIKETPFVPWPMGRLLDLALKNYTCFEHPEGIDSF